MPIIKFLKTGLTEFSIKFGFFKDSNDKGSYYDYDYDYKIKSKVLIK